MSLVYSEMTTYSPLHDCDLTRLSVVDPAHKRSEFRGAEYFCLIPRNLPPVLNGRRMRWRDIRQSALDQLEDAIAQGAEPGKIIVALDKECRSTRSSAA